MQAGTVIATFVHVLPVALASAPGTDGNTVAFAVTGDGAGTWQLTRRSGRWHLRAGAPPDPTAYVTTTIGGAWRLFTQHPRTPPSAVTGDPAVTNAVRTATATIR